MLALLALALMAKPAPAEVWPRAHECHAFVEVVGSFSAQGRDEVNRLNAPAVGQPPRPPPLEVSAEALAALNAQRQQALLQALGDLGLAPSTSARDLARWKAQARPIAEGQGDRYFVVRAELAGDNGLGGTHGGLDLHLVLSSLHRARDIVGEAWATVPATPAEQAQGALRATYLAALTGAFADLRAHSGDEQARPRATLTLRVELAGLSEPQRQAAAALARCAAELATPVETAALPPEEEASQLSVTYRLRRYEPDETEAGFLQGYADRLSFEVGAHGKKRCSTFGTPLAGLEPHVRLEAEARRVVLRFSPPEP